MSAVESHFDFSCRNHDLKGLLYADISFGCG